MERMSADCGSEVAGSSPVVYPLNSQVKREARLPGRASFTAPVLHIPPPSRARASSPWRGAPRDRWTSGAPPWRPPLERYAMILDPCIFLRHGEACQVSRTLPELCFGASIVGVGQLH